MPFLHTASLAVFGSALPSIGSLVRVILIQKRPVLTLRKKGIQNVPPIHSFTDSQAYFSRWQAPNQSSLKMDLWISHLAMVAW